MSLPVTCAEEILLAMQNLAHKYRRDAFTVKEIIQQVMEQNNSYKESTITKEIMFKLRADTADHHEKSYPRIVRASRGYYRLA